MLKCSCLFLAIFMASMVLVQSDLVEVDNCSRVRPGGSKTKIGDVYGARSCGGEGKFIQWRLEECKTTDSPCLYPADGETHICEFTFIPSRNVEQLGFKQIASINGSDPIIVEHHPLEDSKLAGGIKQTIRITGRVPEENKGIVITTQIIFYRLDDQVVEMCQEAEFIMV